MEGLPEVTAMGRGMGGGVAYRDGEGLKGMGAGFIEVGRGL